MKSQNKKLNKIKSTISKRMKKTKKTGNKISKKFPYNSTKKKSTKSYFDSLEELDLFHYMLDQIGDEVCMVDSEGRILYVNKANLDATGFNEQDVIGKEFTTFLKDKMTVKKWKETHFAQLKRKKKPISFIVNRVSKSDEVQLLDVTAVYMKYQNKEYVLTVNRNISEAASLNARLRESEDRYKLLTEQAADGIFAIDLDGIIIYSNRAAEKIAKISKYSSLGKNFVEYIEKNSRKKALNFLKQIKKGTPSIKDEINVVDINGNMVPVEFTATANYKNGKVFQIHIIVRDISKRKQLDYLMIESEKMKALQSFISGTAQEIQGPLKGLYDCIQNLVKEYKDRNYEYIGYNEFRNIMTTLQIITDQTKYCHETINNLINISRKKTNYNVNYCDVNKMIKDSVETFKYELKVSDIKLKSRLSSRLPKAAINPLELKQAITNVITNSFQSITAEGNINVKTSFIKHKDLIRIDVSDDGMGISKDILPHIFEPFFTTKQRGLDKNSGLGLSIVYSIIKRFKGEISIKSSLKKGTSIIILLPIYKNHNKKY